MKSFIIPLSSLPRPWCIQQSPPFESRIKSLSPRDTVIRQNELLVEREEDEGHWGGRRHYSRWCSQYPVTLTRTYVHTCALVPIVRRHRRPKTVSKCKFCCNFCPPLFFYPPLFLPRSFFAIELRRGAPKRHAASKEKEGEINLIQGVGI